MRFHRGVICVFWLLQFFVTKGHSNWDVIEGLFLASGHYTSLWPKTICGRWSLQFLMSKGNSNWDVTDRLFVASGCYGSLWLKSTTIEISWRGFLRPLVTTVPFMAKNYLWPLVATVPYVQRQQQLRCHRDSIGSLWLLQFIMAIGHSNWDVT